MSIPTARGAVQLNQVAYLSYENEDGMIWRRNLLPTVTVNAGIIDSVTGNDVTNEIWLASEELRKQLPLGVKIEIDGPSEKSVKSLASILRPVPAMLIIMVILLMRTGWRYSGPVPVQYAYGYHGADRRSGAGRHHHP